MTSVKFILVLSLNWNLTGNWNQESFSFDVVNFTVPGVGPRYDALSLMSSLSSFELGPCYLSRIKWSYISCCKDWQVFSTCKGQGETPSKLPLQIRVDHPVQIPAQTRVSWSRFLGPVRVWLVPNWETPQCFLDNHWPPSFFFLYKYFIKIIFILRNWVQTNLNE